MKKRNGKIMDFITPNNAKPLCAKFGTKSMSIIASGDDKNTVSLWRLNKESPLITLNPQTPTQSVVSEISTVCFGIAEDEVYSGTNRGSINIWDITSGKRHSVSVNALSIFPNDDQRHLLLSGSYDSSVKLWDMRQKTCVNAYKGHTMQINTIQVSPDGKWFASGSQDNLIKIWNISTGKCLQTFDLHDSPILSLKFNPNELTLASGAADKMVKYWDLDNFGLLYGSKPEATGIQALTFNKEGNYLFTAAQDSLKVWHVKSNGLLLIDNVESSWRGVQDIAVDGTDENLIGLAITNSTFGLWACSLSNVNRDPNIPADKFLAIRMQELKNKFAQQQDSYQPNQASNNQQEPKQVQQRGSNGQSPFTQPSNPNIISQQQNIFSTEKPHDLSKPLIKSKKEEVPPKEEFPLNSQQEFYNPNQILTKQNSQTATQKESIKPPVVEKYNNILDQLNEPPIEHVEENIIDQTEDNFDYLEQKNYEEEQKNTNGSEDIFPKPREENKMRETGTSIIHVNATNTDLSLSAYLGGIADDEKTKEFNTIDDVLFGLSHYARL